MTFSSKASKRRVRTLDSLANPQAVNRILSEINEVIPTEISHSPQLFNQFLLAVKHHETYISKNSKRGRPGKFPKLLLTKVSQKLKSSLDKETGGRVSLRTFVDHYLKILKFSDDIVRPLISGSINLFEAEQLARLTAKNLKMPERQAKHKRENLLSTHIAIQESGARLRFRVNEILGVNSTEISDESVFSKTTKEPFYSNQLVAEINSDPTHLFFDQIQQLIINLSNIQSEDLSNEVLDEVLNLTDQIFTLLTKARKKSKAKFILGT